MTLQEFKAWFDGFERILGRDDLARLLAVTLQLILKHLLEPGRTD